MLAFDATFLLLCLSKHSLICLIEQPYAFEILVFKDLTSRGTVLC